MHRLFQWKTLCEDNFWHFLMLPHKLLKSIVLHLCVCVYIYIPYFLSSIFYPPNFYPDQADSSSSTLCLLCVYIYIYIHPIFSLPFSILPIFIPIKQTLAVLRSVCFNGKVYVKIVFRIFLCLKLSHIFPYLLSRR